MADEPAAMRLRGLALWLLLTASAGADPASLVLSGGSVHTMDAARTRATSVAIDRGRIVYVGNDPRPFIGPSTRVVELDGKMVLPAFHDCHVHPVAGGIEMRQCSLYGLTTPEQLLARVASYAREHPEGWIVGAGWLAPTFPDSNPRREMLDAVVPDRPVYLVAADGHSAWVNTAALKAAGIGPGTADPPLGRIERDASGQPSGTLRETALDLVAPHLPKTTPQQALEGLRAGLELAASLGITTLHEARATELELEAYAELQRRGALTSRVIAALWVDPARGPEQVAALRELRRRYTRGRLQPRAAKLFADGIVEGHTAALLAPYLDTATSGELNFDPARMAELVTMLDAADFQVHVHCIGDRATRVSLDSLEAARSRNGWRDTRPHLAHVEMIDPADYGRFGRLDVGATFQPLWACNDDYVVKLTLPVLGPERTGRLYPMASVRRLGGRVAGGSDWPVSSMSPLEAIQVAVTRRSLEQGPGPPWIPDERLDLDAALAAYTREGGYRSFSETGSLEVGKQADVVVLERDLFQVPAHEIGSVKVLWTLLEGEEIYRSFSPTNAPSSRPSSAKVAKPTKTSAVGSSSAR